MTTSVHHVGDLRRLSAQWKVDGAAVDPTAVRFVMLEPDGVETVYVYGTDPELQRDAARTYFVDWVIQKPGRHTYRFEGTGLAYAAEPGEFYALGSATGG